MTSVFLFRFLSVFVRFGIGASTHKRQEISVSRMRDVLDMTKISSYITFSYIFLKGWVYLPAFAGIGLCQVLVLCI